MDHQQTVNQLLEQIKVCPASEFKDLFTRFVAVFPLIGIEQKMEIAADFYAFAEGRAEQEPMVFAYATYLKGLSAFFREDYETGIAMGIESQRQFVELNDSDGSALGSSLLGTLYRSLGNTDLALNALWEGYRHLKASGAFPHNFMACAYQIGSIYVDMKNYGEALPLFQSTLELAERLQNPTWIINSLHGLGKASMEQGHFEEARNFLQRGMEVSVKVNPLFAATSMTDLGLYHYKVKEYAEAERFNKEALAIREEMKYLSGAITNCIRLGQVALESGRAEEAETYLLRGLSMAEQLGIKPKMYQIHLLLSEIHEQRNEPAKSLEHFKQYHALLEEVEMEDASKKVKNLQVIFEAEQTKKENAIIRAQKQEIEKKNRELQETIDELTITKVSKKAKIITFAIAIVLFVIEEVIIHSALHLVPAEDFTLSFVVKAGIIFSLKPIDQAVEHYLLKRIMFRKKT